MENLYTKDCIRTFTGKYFNIFEPDINLICIEDIAHSLSHQCRFAGHLPVFYSVAQHCVLATLLMDTNEDKFDALMHDSSEAYLIDIPSPIKQRLSNYKEIEHNLMSVLSKKLKFNYPFNDLLHKVDKDMLEFEWKHIMLSKGKINGIDIWDSERAKKEFLILFNELKPKEWI